MPSPIVVEDQNKKQPSSDNNETETPAVVSKRKQSDGTKDDEQEKTKQQRTTAPPAVGPSATEKGKTKSTTTVTPRRLPASIPGATHELRCYYALRKGRYHNHCIFFDQEELDKEVEGFADAEFNIFFNISLAASYIDVVRPVGSLGPNRPFAPVMIPTPTATAPPYYPPYPQPPPFMWNLASPLPTLPRNNNTMQRNSTKSKTPREKKVNNPTSNPNEEEKDDDHEMMTPLPEDLDDHIDDTLDINNDTLNDSSETSAKNNVSQSKSATSSTGQKMTKLQQDRYTKWDEMYQKLVKYEEEHGSCKVSDDDELEKWMASQRRSYNVYKKNQSIVDANQHAFTVLTDERLQKLLDLGAVFPSRRKNLSPQEENERWEEMYNALKEYKSHHGHCEPKQNVCPSLYKWVKDQRGHYNNVREGKSSVLTMQRIQRLNDIGFKWDKERSKRTTFEDRLAELKVYKDKYGHCIVPRPYPGGLGKWVAQQRTKRKWMLNGKPSNMTEEKAKQLDDLGMAWEVIKSAESRAPRKTWNERFEELLEFKQEHGHTVVPQHYPGLGGWVHRNRVHYKLMKQGRKSDMSQEQAFKLADIGFAFEVMPRKNPTGPPAEGAAPKLHFSSFKLLNASQQTENLNNTETSNVESNNVDASDAEESAELLQYEQDDLPQAEPSVPPENFNF